MRIRSLGGVASLLLVACAGGPEPIRWGSDTCDECRMVLEDRRFVAEVIDRRAYKFDGLDELVRFRHHHPLSGRTYVGDGESGHLIPAEHAVFLSSSDLHGPMGAQVMAFGDRPSAEVYARQHHLTHLAWPTLREVMGPAEGR